MQIAAHRRLSAVGFGVLVAVALATVLACAAPATQAPVGGPSAAQPRPQDVPAPLPGSLADPVVVPEVQSAGQAHDVAEVPVGLAVGMRAPSFTATLLDGNPITDADLQAQGKPYILYFYATW